MRRRYARLRLLPTSVGGTHSIANFIHHSSALEHLAVVVVVIDCCLSNLSFIMSFVDSVKKAGKSVVNAGAKTMLKVRSFVRSLLHVASEFVAALLCFENSVRCAACEKILYRQVEGETMNESLSTLFNMCTSLEASQLHNLLN